MTGARAITDTIKFPTAPPRRSGRYDLWLDGRMWELHSDDFAWFPVRADRMKRGRRGLVSRARERGLIVHISVLVDGAIVVQAAPEVKPRARRALKTPAGVSS